MKKKIALLLIVSMMFMLCACGGGNKDANQNDQSGESWAPDGPVTMIVSYKAGNGTDLTARILAQHAEKYIGQTVVI